MLKENLPGTFPYTAGVFAFKRDGEDPTRMFAGEGDAFRTNARFKMVSKDFTAKRLSTASIRSRFMGLTLTCDQIFTARLEIQEFPSPHWMI